MHPYYKWVYLTIVKMKGSELVILFGNEFQSEIECGINEYKNL